MEITVGNETFVIEDEDWEDIEKDVWKQINGNLDLRNRFLKGEKIEYRIITINDEGKEDTLTFLISKQRSQRSPRRWREKRRIKLDAEKMIQSEESETEVVEWEEF